MQSIESNSHSLQSSSAFQWRYFLQAARPRTLLVGIAPVTIGISLALANPKQSLLSGTEQLLSAWAALVIVVLLQAAANMVNDAKDAIRGVDHSGRVGPVRVVQSGLLSAQAIRYGYMSMFLIVGLLVLVLSLTRHDPLISLVAFACAAVAYLYTAGPIPLAYIALGELVACLFFGPIAVMGTAYLVLGWIDWSSAGWGVGTGLIAGAIMAINNLRDRQSDRVAGKYTLAILLGEARARSLPLLLVLMSAMVLALYGIQNHKLFIAVPWTLLSFMFIRRRITPRLSGEAEILNEALQFTALFNVFYALLFCSLILL